MRRNQIFLMATMLIIGLLAGMLIKLPPTYAVAERFNWESTVPFLGHDHDNSNDNRDRCPETPGPSGGCPRFAGVQSFGIHDGGCKLDHSHPLTDVVPLGFWALYWTGTHTARAEEGAEITTATATFYRKGS